jgi:hypothetical protein
MFSRLSLFMPLFQQLIISNPNTHTHTYTQAFDTLPDFAMSEEGRDFLAEHSLIVPLEGDELERSVKATRVRMRMTQTAAV